MTETTLGRTVAVLTALSILLHSFSYFFEIEVLKLPPSRFPYWWSILGSALMIWIPIGLWRGGSVRFALFFSIFTFATGVGMCYGALVRG